jgi:hypothetical protein
MRWTLVMTMLLGGLPVFGQEVASEVAKVADFGKGLEQLGRLAGLPEMRGAKWIKEGGGGAASMDYELRQLRGAVKGSGWEIAGKPGLMAFGECTMPEAAAHGAADGTAKPEQAARRESLAKADAAGLSKALRDPQISGNYVSQMEYGETSFLGRCLIFAVQLHAAGETEAASDLAAAIFALAPEKSVMIDAAITKIANDEYTRATAKFFDGYNWQAYRDELKVMVGKFPRGWRDGPGVELLISAVEKRIAGAAAGQPSLAGIELKPAALDALQRLLAAPDKQGLSDAELFKKFGVNESEIPAAQRAAYLAMLRNEAAEGFSSRSASWLLTEEPTEGTDPVAQLKAMRMDGLIALAAVATDETLTPRGNQSEGRSSRFSSEAPSAESLYLALNRPQTRGELAMELLAQVVPAGMDREPVDAEQLRDDAVEFWKEFRAKSGVEMAGHYLAEGDRQQIQMAAGYLAASDDPAAHAVFEQAVLAGEPASYLSEVDRYLTKRGPAAAEFFKSFSKAISEAQEGDDSSDNDYLFSRSGGVEKYLAGLAIKVGAVSLTEMVAAALKPAPDPEEEDEDEEDGSAISKLESAIASVPMAECLKAFAAASAKATPNQLMDIHYLLLTRAVGGAQRAPEAEEAKVVLPAEVLDLWRPLLANTTSFPEAHENTPMLESVGCKNFGDSAALVLELAEFPDSWRIFMELLRVVDSPAEAFRIVRERAQAAAAGKTPPAWPSAESVSAERSAQIKSQISKLPAAEIPPHVASLSLDERLALADILAQFDDEENPPPAGLLELRFTVTSTAPRISWFPTDAELLEKSGVATGFVASPENLEKLCAHLASDAKQFSTVALFFMPAPLHLGWVANAGRIDVSHAAAFRQLDVEDVAEECLKQDAEAVIALNVEGSNGLWAVRKGKAEPLKTGEDIVSSLKEIAASKALELPPFSILVLSRADAEKIAQP